MNSIFFKGAVRDELDLRDYRYSPLGAAPFDWNVGYDIEREIGYRLVTKNQGHSLSCGGQAWGYYGEVLEAVATKSYEPRSSRWIYSHTFAPGGGSMGRPNCNFVVNNGWAREADAISYENGESPSEEFMRTVPVLSHDAQAVAEVSRALSYLQVKPDIDHIAQAIVENHGCIIGIGGQNNGTWHSLYPQPPIKEDWGHWLYAGKVRLIDGKKYIGVKNSWGDDVGDHGWQYIGESYFNSGHIWYGWTLAWDYTPSKLKGLMNQVITLMISLIAQLKK